MSVIAISVLPLLHRTTEISCIFWNSLITTLILIGLCNIMILSNNKVLTRPQYYIHKQPLYQSLIPKPWYRNIKSTDNGVCQYHRALTLFFLSCSRVHVHASTFLLLHYKIYSHYLPTYNHSKQPDNILSLYLHPVHCRNNLSNNLCQLDSVSCGQVQPGQVHDRQVCIIHRNQENAIIMHL